jgi:hypothetical protein
MYSDFNKSIAKLEDMNYSMAYFLSWIKLDKKNQIEAR